MIIANQESQLNNFNDDKRNLCHILGMPYPFEIIASSIHSQDQIKEKEERYKTYFPILEITNSRGNQRKNKAKYFN